MASIEVDSYDKILRWSYNLARIWVQEHLIVLGVTSSRKFDAYKRNGNYLPKYFPRKPDEYFKNKGVWKGWPDFLGKPSNFIERSYVEYHAASAFCRENKIKNSIEYRNWKNRPDNLPARPDQYYKKQWHSWKSFLGNSYEIPMRKLSSKLSLADVRIIKHQLKLGVQGAVLAKTFGVSEMQISRIKKGENWKAI
jgi:hypothetical protein